MSDVQRKYKTISELPVALDSDLFLRSLIRELSGVLEDVVGLGEAAGFISVVGQHIGHQVDLTYKDALQIKHLDKRQIAEVLQDLKQRINGDFYIIEADEKKIVFGNRICPFGDKVLGRPSLCMMTSNVFGTIAAQNNGYAKVKLEQTIARGDNRCRVVVYLEDTDEALADEGREYFRVDE